MDRKQYLEALNMGTPEGLNRIVNENLSFLYERFKEKQRPGKRKYSFPHFMQAIEILVEEHAFPSYWLVEELNQHHGVTYLLSESKTTIVTEELGKKAKKVKKTLKFVRAY